MASTQRVLDSNGWFEVKNNPLSKVGVFPYLGKEIGAPEPERVYQVLRSAEELGSKGTMDSFKLIPIVNDHTMIGPNKGSMSAESKGVEGITGETVVFDGSNLLGNIKIYSDKMSGLIDSGKDELSCGYSCEYVARTGTAFGQAFDYEQINLRGNHVALVQKGRMGKEVRVQDSDIMTFDSAELISMKTPEQILMEATIAQAKLNGFKLEGFGCDSTSEELHAALTAENLATKTALDKAVPVMSDTSGMDALNTAIEDLSGRLEASEAAIKTAAMDARVDFAERTEVLEKHKSVLGTLQHNAMDTAEFFQHACDKLEIECAGGSARTAYHAANKFITYTAPVAKTGFDAAPEDSEAASFLKSILGAV